MLGDFSFFFLSKLVVIGVLNLLVDWNQWKSLKVLGPVLLVVKMW